jgi:hypothetical protein
MDTDGQGMLQFPTSEKLYRFLPFEKAGLKQKFGLHHRLFRETIEISHMNDGKVFFKGGMKSSFGKASLEGHLASLETRLGSSSGTGILALGSPTGRFAMAGPNPSPHPLMFFPRSLWRFQLI